MTATGQDQSRIGAAAGMVIVAMAVIGLIDNFIRLIATETGLWQFHLLRSAIALLLIAILSKALGWSLWPMRLRPVLARSLFISGSMLLYFGCLSVLPIGQVVAGLFTAPIFILLISAFFYGARVGPVQALAVGLGFVGIMLILRLDEGSLSLLSVLPVISGLLYAIGNVATREWCKGEKALTLLFGFFGFMMLWGILGLGLLALVGPNVPAGAEGVVLRGWVRPQATFLLVTLVQAVGSVIGVGLIIRAYQIAPASRVAVFEKSLLVFAALWAWLLWGEGLSPVAMLGMVAVGLAGVLIALPERPEK